MATSHSDQVGARSIGAGGKAGKKGGILKWLLPLLLLLIAAAILIALLTGGDDKDAASTANPPAVSQSQGAGAGAGANAAGTGKDGTLVAAQQSLLGAEASIFGAAIGEQVTGTGVEVVSVVEGEGFFVGTSESDRVYVEFGAEVGEDETAADFTPAVGDRVNLEGELRPAPAEPGRTLHLEAADAQVVEQQGAFVNATNVARGS